MNQSSLFCSIIRRTLNGYQASFGINSSRRYVTFMAVPRISNLPSLRTTSAALFVKSDFRDVCWAGVFGSFARNTHTDRSDVDVVVWRKSALERRM